MHTAHGMVRSMTDCTGARALIREGVDAKASAPIKRAERGAEEAVEQGIVWLDLVPGTKNPADLSVHKEPSKHWRISRESRYHLRLGPFLYESKDFRAILAGGHTPVLKSKEKIKKQQNSEIDRNLGSLLVLCMR